MALSITPDQVDQLVAREFPASYAEGNRCVELAEGTALARWTFDPTKLRPGAYVPGTVLFALADSTLWYACFTVLGLEPMAVTSEMSIRYLRPAQGGDVLARATLNSVSTRRLVGTVEMWVDGAPERLVAVAQGSYSPPTTRSNAMNPPAAHEGAGAS